jgi:hypothetical protein
MIVIKFNWDYVPEVVHNVSISSAMKGIKGSLLLSVNAPLNPKVSFSNLCGDAYSDRNSVLFYLGQKNSTKQVGSIATYSLKAGDSS